MIKIYGVGRGKRAEGNSLPEGGKKQPGEIRMQTEIAELELPPQCQIEFPEKDNVMNFHVIITPDEGFWRRASYRFEFKILPLYPHEPPKVKCSTQVYHPNIDSDGNICLNILRDDWKPVLSISSVVYGLLYLFLEPNAYDPLNKEAAEVLRDNRSEFGRIVERTLRGGSYDGQIYPRLV